MRHILDEIDGYAITLTPFYKMEEPDWIILRLIGDSPDNLVTETEIKAAQYLFDKYGNDIVFQCREELLEERYKEIYGDA
jgi:hypothetical protein